MPGSKWGGHGGVARFDGGNFVHVQKATAGRAGLLFIACGLCHLIGDHTVMTMRYTATEQTTRNTDTIKVCSGQDFCDCCTVLLP